MTIDNYTLIYGVTLRKGLVTAILEYFAKQPTSHVARLINDTNITTAMEVIVEANLGQGDNSTSTVDYDNFDYSLSDEFTDLIGELETDIKLATDLDLLSQMKPLGQSNHPQSSTREWIITLGEVVRVISTQFFDNITPAFSEVKPNSNVLVRLSAFFMQVVAGTIDDPKIANEASVALLEDLHRRYGLYLSAPHH